jgi:hypothetical protein
MGFCEGVLSLSGATQVEARFLERSWEDATRTVLELTWSER